MIEKVFGSKSTFGIRYVPGWKSEDGRHYFGKLHLILADQLIGDESETCLIGTWMYYMKRTLNLIIQDIDKLYHEEFKNRTDEEIFELIYKSNQCHEEYDPVFHYLPVITNDIWVSCNINIDETIDAYKLVMIKNHEQIKFIWKGWRKPCQSHRINKLFSITAERKLVIKSISECLEFVKNDLKEYKNGT